MGKRISVALPEDVQDWIEWPPALGGCKDQTAYIIGLIRADRCAALREELSPERWHAWLTSIDKDPHVHDSYLKAPYGGLMED